MCNDETDALIFGCFTGGTVIYGDSKILRRGESNGYILIEFY